MTPEELKSAAADIARALQGGNESIAPEVRARFLSLRAELIRRGLFDPVLIRFDTATVPKASASQIAEQLNALVPGLTPH